MSWVAWIWSVSRRKVQILTPNPGGDAHPAAAAGSAGAADAVCNGRPQQDEDVCGRPRQPGMILPKSALSALLNPGFFIKFWPAQLQPVCVPLSKDIHFHIKTVCLIFDTGIFGRLLATR